MVDIVHRLLQETESKFFMIIVCRKPSTMLGRKYSHRKCPRTPFRGEDFGSLSLRLSSWLLCRLDLELALDYEPRIQFLGRWP